VDLTGGGRSSTASAGERQQPPALLSPPSSLTVMGISLNGTGGILTDRSGLGLTDSR
jgi:hypothetical protein